MSKSLLRTILKVVVSVALLAFLMSKISLDEALESLRHMNLAVMAAAISIFFVSNALGAIQWFRLLRASGVSIPFIRAFRFYFVGLFFNNFLPANIGGDAMKVYDVTRIGSSVYQVIAVTLLDRLIGIFSLCLLAVGAVIYLMVKAPIDSLGLYLLIFLGCMTPVAAFYFIEPLSKLLRAIVARLRPLSMDQRFTSILDYLGEFKTRKRTILRLILLSLVIQSLRTLTHVTVGLALGIELTPTLLALFFVFVPLLSLAMIPPITINGLGIREGLGIVLFAQAGIASTDAFTLEFLTYLVSVSVSLLGMGFFLSRRGRPVAQPVEEKTNPDAV